MIVIESQETVNRKLGSHIIIFPTKHLFTHTRTNLGLEIQDCSAPEITSFTALIVLGVLGVLVNGT